MLPKSSGTNLTGSTVVQDVQVDWIVMSSPDRLISTMQPYRPICKLLPPSSGGGETIDEDVLDEEELVVDDGGGFDGATHETPANQRTSIASGMPSRARDITANGTAS